MYEAQKTNTTKGDWIELVQKDFQLIEENFDEDILKNMSKYQYKKFVKDRIGKAAFKYLEGEKNKHSKIRDIKYKNLKIQSYILSDQLSNEDVCMLFALRSRMIKVKRNFSNQFGQNLSCTLGCRFEESQNHLLKCEYILNKMDDKDVLTDCEYSDLFGNIEEQVEIAKIFSEILKIREELLQL